MQTNFFSEDEQKICDDFLEKGFTIFDLNEASLLEVIRTKIFDWSRALVDLDGVSKDSFFNSTHDYIKASDLNDFRVSLIRKLEETPEIRHSIFQLGKKQIQWIVGNELCMQRGVNLSVQMPQDHRSLLPLHSDVWSGNSPFEVVFWLPLVNCYKTKSMFVLPYKKSVECFHEFTKYSKMTSEDLFLEIEKDLVWLNVDQGQGVIFSHSILHGNRVNEEPETRWTFNTRFKAALSPYGNKELGESFVPISLRPATRVGHAHFNPSFPRES